MSIIFSQQILNDRLLLIIIVEVKKNLSDRFDNIVGQAIQRAICP